MSYPVNADDLRAALEELLSTRALLYRTNGSAACCDETTRQSDAVEHESCSRQDPSATALSSRVARSGAQRLFAPRNSYASCQLANVSIATPDCFDTADTAEIIDMLNSTSDLVETPTVDGSVSCHYAYADSAADEDAGNELLDLEEFMAAQLRADGDGECADGDGDGGECHLESCNCSRSRSNRLNATRNSSVSEADACVADATDGEAEGGEDKSSRSVAGDDEVSADHHIGDDNSGRDFGVWESRRSTLSCKSWDDLELTCADLDAQNVQILELDLTLMLRRPADADVRCDLLTVEFLASPAHPAMATAF